MSYNKILLTNFRQCNKLFNRNFDLISKGLFITFFLYLVNCLYIFKKFYDANIIEKNLP